MTFTNAYQNRLKSPNPRHRVFADKSGSESIFRLISSTNETIGDGMGQSETTDVQHPQARLYDNSRLMTKREVADYFRVSTRTIDRWSKAGKIRKIKVGGEARFKSQEVAELLGEEG